MPPLRDYFYVYATFPHACLHLQRVDLGDLSYLLQPAYSNAMRAALASATRWVYSPTATLDFEANKTYFVTYTIEEYQRLATRLKLWPYPRGHHQFVASIPFK